MSDFIYAFLVSCAVLFRVVIVRKMLLFMTESRLCSKKPPEPAYNDSSNTQMKKSATVSGASGSGLMAKVESTQSIQPTRTGMLAFVVGPEIDAFLQVATR